MGEIVNSIKTIFTMLSEIVVTAGVKQQVQEACSKIQGRKLTVKVKEHRNSITESILLATANEEQKVLGDIGSEEELSAL